MTSRRFHSAVPAAVVVVVLCLVVGCDGTNSARGPTPSSGQITPSSTPVKADDGKVPIPARGAYFGAYTFAGKEGRQASITSLEQQIGRKFDIDHRFYRWDSAFPTPEDQSTAQQGRIAFWNWSSLLGNGTQVSWADIAAGKQDDVIDARAAAVRAFGHPIFLAFQHEPGGQVGRSTGDAGTAEDYRNAWRHIIERFRSRQVTNVSWTWILTAFAFAKGNPDGMYPGDDVIDWIAADGYNSFDCFGGRQHWRLFKEIYSDFYAWGRKHHKPLMSAEYGSVEDPAKPGRKGDWFRDLGQTLQQWPEFKALVYFNSAPACQNWVTTSATALAGFRDLGLDPYIRAAARTQ